jgi:dTDP-4-amino-4,6-dideoxygalactose transaminase
MNDLIPDFSDIENKTYNLDLNKLEDRIKGDKTDSKIRDSH